MRSSLIVLLLAAPAAVSPDEGTPEGPVPEALASAEAGARAADPSARVTWTAEGPQAVGSRTVPLLPAPEATADAVARLVAGRLRLRRIALLAARDRPGRALEQALRRSLEEPAGLVFVLPISTDHRRLNRALRKQPADALLLDASPEACRKALAGALAQRPETLFVSPRGFDGGPLSRRRGRVFLLHAADPRTAPGGAAWLRDLGGEIAFPALALAAHAAASLASGGSEVVHEPTGPVRLAGDGLEVPIGLFLCDDGRAVPHLPALLEEEGSTDRRAPDPEFGPPFGTFDPAQFRPHENTQVVVFTWGEGEERTIDRDLAELGLSTGGEDPLVDHLVREEVMGRLLSITAAKFLWNPDGTPRPGESIALSLTAHAPKRGRVWTAVVAGDHEDAGGVAYPGRGLCRIFSTFIRRTIFQPHALDPPLSSDDLPYLDGSYRFGGDRARDLRSQTIRALIHGYAGSMALTAAHEIGHLCGLGHTTEDPRAIMNVEEGAGLDPRDGRFTRRHLEALARHPGLVERSRRR